MLPVSAASPKARHTPLYVQAAPPDPAVTHAWSPYAAADEVAKIPQHKVSSTNSYTMFV